MAAPEPRRSRTEAERAQEAHGIALRKVEKLRAAETALDKQLKATKNERLDAERLLAYRAQHPALPTSNKPEPDATAPAPTEEETTKP